jgi:hypothetical protein
MGLTGTCEIFPADPEIMAVVRKGFPNRVEILGKYKDILPYRPPARDEERSVVYLVKYVNKMLLNFYQGKTQDIKEAYLFVIGSLYPRKISKPRDFALYRRAPDLWDNPEVKHDVYLKGVKLPAICSKCSNQLECAVTGIWPFTYPCRGRVGSLAVKGEYDAIRIAEILSNAESETLDSLKDANIESLENSMSRADILSDSEREFIEWFNEYQKRCTPEENEDLRLAYLAPTDPFSEGETPPAQATQEP